MEFHALPSSCTGYINEKALDYNFTNEGGVENTIRFHKNIIGLWPVQECKRQWQREGVELSYAFWETAIIKYPDAVGFAGNCAFDGPNLGKLKVLNEADWGIATFDLEPETLEFIEEGVLTVAMGINPWLNAYLATELAYNHLVSGEALPVNSQIDSGPELVTSENVTDFLAREKDLELKHSFHLDLMAENFSDLDSLIIAR